MGLNRLELVKPCDKYIDKIIEYKEAHLKEGETTLPGSSELYNTDDIKGWIQKVNGWSRGENIPEGRVRSTVYLVLNKENDEIVGITDIRYELNEYLLKYGGHIGYSVRPDQRRKGYAKEMLKMVLGICRDLKMNKVLITCSKDNEGSRRTILSQGGILENEVKDKEIILERYWINL